MLIATAAAWAAMLALCAAHLRVRRRLVLVARASHEVRGPLCAAQLGLHGLGGEPGRLAAIDLELRRAGRALDDLAAAPAGRRARDTREPVDLVALALAYAPSWRTLAAAHGAGFRLEVVTPAARPATAGSAGPATSGTAGPGTAGSVGPGTAASVGPGTAGSVGPGTAGSVGPATAAFAGFPSPPGAAAGGRTVATDLAPALREPAPATVFADPLRIAQACANLVANAAEHGGGMVRVRVRTGAGTARLEVADDGPGLPAPVPAMIAAARSGHGRRGHGLAVAAAIAEHQGGRLVAAPAARGARLAIELPALVPGPPARRREAAPPPIVA